ncbi:flagellar biosynthesis anti-sigma factor FlgM [Stutzerimonas nosocomialis]|uniref:flagellar biosynthesis anti-sigma factor FlgM n=1 Tax=Stutzerimonas nosocomialis TaxID=1056496 RepID=UPI00110808E1|nr:flagellar biosynthesis anti-sigma factor FlgM [Stutzerimonas nosocomialis]TLX59177.1 flagellar biosynthesis anti-sigma factor FlgM [Stutzerimonas nosocomialis]
MEISRHFKPVLATPVEASGKSRAVEANAASSASQRPAVTAQDLPLEQLQAALRAMPDVDLDKVAAIKQALQRGEISTDPAALASSVMTYHSGSDA